MNQQKHIITAFFILLIIAGGYFIVEKFLSTKNADNPIIKDYDKATNNSDSGNIDGKAIFQKKCASCHNVFKEGTGPALRDVWEKNEWRNKAKLYDYIRFPEKYDKDKYIKSVRQKYRFRHIGFPDLTDKEIDAVFRYISYTQYKKALPVA